jgi:hypothetical protein
MKAMTMQRQEGFARWYDQSAELKKVVEIICTFPDEVQTILAQGMIQLAERDYQTSDMMLNLKSMGSERILGLHKSKGRLREYDRNPHTHKAINYLYILSDDNRRFMARQVLELYEHILNYMKLCITHQERVKNEILSGLTKAYVTQGSAAARRMLQEIRLELQNRLIEAGGGTHRFLREFESGMQIRGI